jgi:hypothetical protein
MAENSMTKEKRVFVVQVPAHKTGPRGAWVEKYDLSPAEKHGVLVRMLDFGNVPEDPAPTRDLLRQAMADFDAETDSLLLIGDPVACAQAVHVLGYDLGVHSFDALKWDRREGQYFPYRVG